MAPTYAAAATIATEPGPLPALHAAGAPAVRTTAKPVPPKANAGLAYARAILAI